MSSSGSLEQYLSRFRSRLKLSLASRGVGALAAAALLLTAVLVFIANQYAFSDASIISARTALIAGLVAVALFLLVRPWLRLKQRGVAGEVEKSVPAFHGRVETYVDANRRAEQGGARSPLLDLLAADALRVAEASPPNEVVTGGRIAAFAGLGVVSLAVLVWLGTAGPGYWGYGTERLWAGWLKTEATPLYDMIVEPGDTTVRSGSSLRVTAEMIGLDADSLEISAQYESGVDWERAPMPPRLEGSGFEFTFVGVTEPFTYYVSGAGIESERYEVNVVEMPDVDNVKLTYAFPEWTGLEPIEEDPGGDVRAVAGTKVQVEVTTDRPLTGGVLIVVTDDGEERVRLSSDDLLARGEIEVTADGSYYVAAMYDGQPVRLTEDFFITAVPDEPPTVKIQSPGRDWKATNIEEVDVRLEGVDDFGLRGMELHYSVNGSEFEKVAIGGGGQKANREHTFYLEDFRSVDPFAVEEIPPAKTPLKPGDLVSYYVIARDHSKSARTDMYFIEIQPFDRRFSQSQQAGGGMQGGQQQQNEISKRQKEIIAATWNLIQERQSGDARSRDEIRESARLLSELQLTLRDQANTLAERTRARQLTDTNETFRLFVEHLELAAKAMEPASDKLASYDLNDALAPEQKALQHVLRAEALFTDIQIAMQQGGGGGGGGAGRDLTEMFELEMDLEKNQYETGGGSGSQQQLETEIDDAFKKLEELAKRQEKLAEQAQNKDAQSFAERWQQEMLRREAEELKRELEQLQRRSQQQQQASNQQGGQQSQSQSGQSGQSGQGGQSQQQQQMLERAIERLERATSEMQQSAQQQQGGQQGSQQQQSGQQQQGQQSGAQQQGGQQGQQAQQQRAAAADRAQQQLNQALSELSQERRAQNTGQLGELARQASDLVERQEKVQPQLEEALRKALAEMKAAEEAGKPRSVPSGLTRQQERQLSAEKAEMFESLERLQRDAQQAVRRMRESQPGASRQVREALSELQDSEVAPNLQKAADYIRRGGAPYVASSEESVSRALREFRDALGEAQRAAAEGPGAQRGRPDLERALSDMQELRRRLEEAAGLGNQQQSGEPGAGLGEQQQAQNGQGEQQGQGGQGQQPQGQGQQQGQGQPGQGQQSAQAGGQPGQQPGGQQPGQQGQQGQQPGQGQQGMQPGQGQGGRGGSGRMSESARGGQTPGQQGPGSGLSRRGGPSTGVSGSNFGENFGEWARSGNRFEDPEAQAEIGRRMAEVAGEVPNLTNRLRRSGIFEEDLRQLRNYVRGLDAERFQGNPELVEREYRELTSLLEQLELQVRRQVEVDQGREVRSLVTQPVPEEYREAVAEYFRKLSEGEGRP